MLATATSTRRTCCIGRAGPLLVRLGRRAARCAGARPRPRGVDDGRMARRRGRCRRRPRLPGRRCGRRRRRALRPRPGAGVAARVGQVHRRPGAGPGSRSRGARVAGSDVPALLADLRSAGGGRGAGDGAGSRSRPDSLGGLRTPGGGRRPCSVASALRARPGPSDERPPVQRSRRPRRARGGAGARPGGRTRSRRRGLARAAARPSRGPPPSPRRSSRRGRPRQAGGTSRLDPAARALGHGPAHRLLDEHPPARVGRRRRGAGDPSVQDLGPRGQAPGRARTASSASRCEAPTRTTG